MDASTSDYVTIAVVVGVLVAVIVGAILMTRYVKRMMKLEDENRRRFASDHGLELHADKSMTGVVGNLPITFKHVYILSPATGMGEGQMKTRPGRTEMFQVEATYPGQHEWFAIERKAGKRYLTNDEQPTTWVDYHRDQLNIPPDWHEVPCADEHFNEHYVVFGPGDRFPEFENQERVLRWLWAKTAFFVIARGGVLQIWIQALDITGQSSKLYETLEKALAHTRSLCSPRS